MRGLIQLILFGIVLWLVYVLFTNINAERIAEEPDPTKIVLYFLGFIALAIIGGVIAAVTIIPAVGERLGEIFYSSGEKIEKDPHAEAVAKIAQGDFENAALIYESIASENPGDLHALSEAARLRCEKLGDCRGGAELIEQALEQEHSADDTAFLAFRLVDIYSRFERDAARAAALLQQIIEKMPDSRHSANAFHRLRALETAQLPLEPPIPTDVESGATPDDRDGEPA